MNYLSSITHINYSDANSWISNKTSIAKEKASYFFENAPPLKNLWPKIERALVFSGLLAFSTLTVPRLPYDQYIDLICTIYILSVTCFFGVVTAYDSYCLPNDWEMQKLTKDQSKQNVVLHCFQRHLDWNGAASRIVKQKVDLFKNLSKTHSMVHVSVSSAKDINAAIDQINARGQKVQILWVNAHGNSRGMRLVKWITSSESKNPLLRVLEKVLPKNNIDSIHFSKLAPKADIVLESCSIGAENPDHLSFAEWAQIHAGRNRNVHAPSKTAVAGGTDYKETSWGKKKFYFSNSEFNSHDLRFIKKDVTANISYDSALKKAQRLGFPAKPDGLVSSFWLKISHIKESYQKFLLSR